MKLNMTYVIQFGTLDLPQSKVLNELGSHFPGAQLLSTSPLSEGLAEYFSESVLFIDFIEPCVGDIFLEKTRLIIFEGGFGTLQTISDIPETTTTTELVLITDKLTAYIEQQLDLNSKFAKISKTFGNWIAEEGVIKTKAKLMWAYSQTCIFETANNFERFSNELSKEAVLTYSDCRIKFDPTATCIFFDKHERMDKSLQLLGSVTLSTALAYNIQNTATKLSRQMLQSPNFNSKFSSINKYVRLVNIMDQYLAEINQDSLNANLDEVVFAKPLANTYELSEVVDKSFKAVKRLKNHVLTLENELSRRQQKRMNNILFTFTLLSVVSISGSLISLYDFTNEISPNIRIVLVSASFVFTSVFVTFLLKWLNVSRS